MSPSHQSRRDPLPSNYQFGDAKGRAVTRVWSDYGFWQYSCGCSQYQDGYHLCASHRPFGYTALVHDFTGAN